MDIYQIITERIISALESGQIPWEKPWVGKCECAIKHVSGQPYSLLNQMLLDKPGEYLTFKQCNDEGGRIKKGAKARFVVFWKMLSCEKKDTNGTVIRDANGKPQMDTIPLLRYYNVFHIDDCEGIKPRHSNKEADPEPFDTIAHADEALHGYICRSGVRLEYNQQDRAYYRPATDAISLPLISQFKDVSGYYETAFHEAVHSTGHKSRLNRLSVGGTHEDYSKEELVAEIGACSILNVLQIETDKSFRNNAAYIQSWLSALKNDKRLIVSAASRAEKAVDMILGKEESKVMDESKAA